MAAAAYARQPTTLFGIAWAVQIGLSVLLHKTTWASATPDITGACILLGFKDNTTTIIHKVAQVLSETEKP